MVRSGLPLLPLLASMAIAVTAAAQSRPAAEKQPATQEARREIFCASLKTGQLCPDSTAEILGLKGPQAEAWKVIVRKYNQGAEAAATGLQKDSAHKLTPEQMEVLKAWFAVGWNEQLNEILYKRNLDDLNQADTQGLSTKKPEEQHAH
jgi:hypothetical protein